MAIPSTTHTHRSGPSTYTSTYRASPTTDRPPVIIEWTKDVVRIGHAGEVRPRHVITPPSPPPLMATEMNFQNLLYPLLQHIYNGLLFISPSSRGLVILTNDLVSQRHFQSAFVKVALLHLGVPVLYWWAGGSLQSIPFVMGWKRGMVIHFSRDDFTCMVQVDGEEVLSSFQTVPGGIQAMAKSLVRETAVSSPDSAMSMELATKMIISNNTDDPLGSLVLNWYLWETRNSTSLLSTVLKSIEACPLDCKRDVIQRIVVVGSGADRMPHLERLLMEHLRKLTKQSTLETTPKAPVSSIEEGGADFASVISTFHSLQPLLKEAKVLSTNPYRPGVISWVGGSIAAVTKGAIGGRWISRDSALKHLEEGNELPITDIFEVSMVE